MSIEVIKDRKFLGCTTLDQTKTGKQSSCIFRDGYFELYL